MKEIVLVTTYKREELLWLCLEAIRREDVEIPVYVWSDRGYYSQEQEEMVVRFKVDFMWRQGHNHYGNSFNLLEACRLASAYADLKICHLIEDDTIIHKGYFEWARKMLSEEAVVGNGEIVPIYAAVCGRIASPHIRAWYESPCATWKADCLRTALAHVVPEYFASTREEMQRVLDTKMFPNSRYKRGGAEQDGFFLRCIEAHGWATAFPPKPLATHLGWWGYNQPKLRTGPTGNFEERIAACRAMFGNREERKKLFGQTITEREMAP